ncbi:MAG: response regulator transcription factor [Ferruginibacter sp.]
MYKLILADDHVLLRDALANLINKFDNFSVTALADNGREIINHVENGVTADIVLMDLNMPVMDGFEAAKWLVKNKPDMKIIILTMYDSEIALIRMLQAGVDGFLKKDINPNELKLALLTVAEGDYYYSNHMTVKIASLFKTNEFNQSNLDRSILNDIEIEFLKLASTEMTYKEIAQKMHLSPRNIDSYRDALFSKLDVKSRVGLVIYAVKNGIVTF